MSSAQAVSEEDRATVVIPPIVATAPDGVRDVIPMPGYRLVVRFFDGVAGVVEISALVLSPDAGVFGPLTDPHRFAEVFIEHGAVTWPGELDLAPDAMHIELSASGKWRLS